MLRVEGLSKKEKEKNRKKRMDMDNSVVIARRWCVEGGRGGYWGIKYICVYKIKKLEEIFIHLDSDNSAF